METMDLFFFKKELSEVEEYFGFFSSSRSDDLSDEKKGV
jgi:hypothetical protein